MAELIDNPPNDTRALAQQAHALFVQRDWSRALAVYQLLAQVHQHPLVEHAQALCMVGLGKAADAIGLLDRALALDPTHWASSLMKAKLLTHLGQPDQAQQLLQSLKANPAVSHEASLDLALLELSEYGHPLSARQQLEPLVQLPSTSERAQAAWWVSNLYDRDITALQLTQHLRRFADTHLTPNDQDLAQFRQFQQRNPYRRTSPKKRIGLLSPLFTASPVYFLTVSTLRALHSQAELYFYDRNDRAGDWATAQLKQLATQWLPCSQHTPLQLAQRMVQDQLDSVIDLGGWMDWAGLKALSFKPAPRQLKWVGGQSTSTCMPCFDGFVCDEWHVPDSLTHLYSEPLIRIQGGYTDYTPPVYLPQALPDSKRSGGYGVIANPNKLSRIFFDHLVQHVLQQVETTGIPLLFIERRYNRPQLRKRVLFELALRDSPRIHALANQGLIRFLSPRNHPEFLTALGNLTALVDTFPYSSGLTAVEALALEVPLQAHTGDLFCERHSHAVLQKQQQLGTRPQVRGAFIAQTLLDYL